MIVQCESCQTKFKVADEKISEQGTLVRCSKCHRTFEVARSSGAPPAEGQVFAGEAPAPRDSAALEHELFGDLPDGDFALEQEYQAYSPPHALVGAPDHSLFEMPRPAPAPAPEPVSSAPRELLPPEEALLPPPPPRSRILGVPGLHAPSARPPPSAPTAKLRGALAGLAVNLGIAAGLLLVLGAVGAIYVNDGKLDPSAFSTRRIRATLRANREAMAVESWNGIYDTKAGKPVFYVRGEAQNTSRTSSKLKVRVEILDGTQLVRSAEALAGAAAGPEELYNIGSSEDADALSARLENSAVAAAPGGRLPFLLTFYDYPPNLSAFSLKVTVSAVGMGKRAGR